MLAKNSFSSEGACVSFSICSNHRPSNASDRNVCSCWPTAFIALKYIGQQNQCKISLSLNRIKKHAETVFSGQSQSFFIGGYLTIESEKCKFCGSLIKRLWLFWFQSPMVVKPLPKPSQKACRSSISRRMALSTRSFTIMEDVCRMRRKSKPATKMASSFANIRF